MGRQRERLGAVGLLNVEMPAGAVRPEFQFSLFRNPNAQPGVGVPRSVFTAYANFDGPDCVS